MNFLFIFSILSVTVCGNPIAPLLADPVAFVATFVNADPETVNKMLGMVTDLETKGENDRANVISDAETKRGISDSKNTALATAESRLTAVQKLLAEAKGLKNELTTREGVERAALTKATSDRDASQIDADEKQASADSITARVSHEVEEFNEVINLLSSVAVPALLETERKLLSVTDADPDAIQLVIEEVNALIEAANEEVSVAVGLNTAAQAKLTTDLATFAAAEAAHTATAGELQSACIDVDNLTDDRDDATIEKNEANSAAVSASLNADDAESFRDAEEKRIDSEAITLGQVRDLLEGLLK